MPFKPRAEQRIADTVIGWEQFPKDRDNVHIPRGAPIGLPMVVTAAADIEHDSFGNVNYTTGAGFDQTLTEVATRQETAYNPGLKIWDGSRLLIIHCRLPQSGKNQWNIIYAWSATRLECVAPVGGIAAGGSASCTSLTNGNGHLPSSPITVYSWTSSVAIGASEELLAELYWDSTASASRWRVYSADCT